MRDRPSYRSPGDHTPEAAHGCDGRCQWRELYQGNLLSLSDLNDKLRQAVGRHGRLRNNLISAMRKAFPGQFLEAERRERRRMSDQSDEVLLRYLQLWLAKRPGTGLAHGPGVDTLRGALQQAGFVLPPDGDLAGWARAVADQDSERRAADGPAPGPAPQTSPVVGVFDPNTQPHVDDPDGAAGPGPVSPEHPSAVDDLAALLFGDDAPDGPAPDGAAPDDPAHPNAAVGAVEGSPDDQPTSEPEPTTSGGGSPAASPPGARDQSSAPLRPTLFPSPSGSSKTRRRRPKATTTASAASPGPAMDVPQTDTPGGGDVPTELHEQAMALVRRPQPLFTSDLVDGGIGTEEQVAAWEQACRDESDSPVRFIPPKARHRQRGALVIPYAYAKKAPADFKRTTWARVLDRFRGARLYEMAVVLHRVGDELMACDLHDGRALLRLNQQRGLTGLLITTESDFEPDDDARAALVEGVEELMGSPLTLLGVLCTNHNALPKAVKALEEEGRARGWDPKFPLIAQRSWEYAADRGSSAVVVLGG